MRVTVLNERGEQIEVEMEEEVKKITPKLSLPLKRSFQNIPEEMMLHCLSYLDPLSLTRCSMVSKFLKR
jgi:hypothetical protein